MECPLFVDLVAKLVLYGPAEGDWGGRGWDDGIPIDRGFAPGKELTRLRGSDEGIWDSAASRAGVGGISLIWNTMSSDFSMCLCMVVDQSMSPVHDLKCPRLQ